jgi:hypothetical protein
VRSGFEPTLFDAWRDGAPGGSVRLLPGAVRLTSGEVPEFADQRGACWVPPGRKRPPCSLRHATTPRLGDDEVEARHETLRRTLCGVPDAAVGVVDVGLAEQVREALLPRIDGRTMSPLCQRPFPGVGAPAVGHGWVTMPEALVDKGILRA